MKSARVSFIFLIFAAIVYSAPEIVVPAIETRTTAVSRTISQEQLLELPLTRNASNLLTLGPVVKSNLDIPEDDQITAATQIIDANTEFKLLLRSFTNANQPHAFVCKTPTDCSPLPFGPLSFSPSLGFAGNSTTGVINMVAKSGTSEFSKAYVYDIKLGKLKGPTYPFYTAPEKLFPLQVLNSVGLAPDGTASFQIPNFTTPPASTSYMFFRRNNALFRPTGPYFQRQLDNVFLSSGVLSNRMPGDPPSYFFGYREYQHIGQPNMTSQVKIQKLYADSFLPIGTPKVFTPPLPSLFPAQEQAQSVAMEPQGSFLIYTQYSPACRKNLLNARKINPDGSPSGAPKLLTPCPSLANSPYGVKALNVIDIK